MLTGQTVLITGAARGIGGSSARECAARGANVALVGLEGEELERTAAACGPNAAAFEADVTDRAALADAIDQAVARFGGLDAVVANAGIAGGGPVRSYDPDAFTRVIEVNVLGVHRTIYAALPHIIERRGYVLPVASLAAAMWSPGMGAYNASKSAVEALGRTLGYEVKHLGVDVGVAYFSWIDTDMVRGADAHPVASGFRQKAPAPFSRTYPLELTGRAVADGIEQRARSVMVPSWLRFVLPARTLLRRLAERDLLKHAPELDARAQEQLAALGQEEMSRPVGAGGAAAEAAQPASVGSRE